jgi:transposase
LIADGRTKVKIAKELGIGIASVYRIMGAQNATA